MLDNFFCGQYIEHIELIDAVQIGGKKRTVHYNLYVVVVAGPFCSVASFWYIVCIKFHEDDDAFLRQ